MERTRKLVGQSIKVLMLLVVGGLLGVWINLEYQKRVESSAETVQIIAVVNMDEGRGVDGEHINYASQLIQFPSDNFEITGLNDAKMGIENGTYAAYIIIPADFSESVLSVEEQPEKIVLEYAINQRLDEEVEKKVVYDINTFEITLNTNIAYMYVDAILTAFHEVQDDSSTILKNDENELLSLQSVDSGELVSWMQQPELSVVASEIEQVNLSTYFTNNETSLNEMAQEYNTSIQQGVSEFASIQTGHTTVTTAMEDFFTLYQAILDESEATNVSVLEDGKQNVELALEVFNQSLPTDYSLMQTQIAQLIEKQREADEISANEQMQEILIQISSVESQTIDSDISLDTIEEAGTENINNMVVEFSALFEMEDDRKLVSDAIQTELIDRLSEEQQGQLDGLLEEGQTLGETMSDYETELENYDPFKYLNATSMNGYLTDISNNTQTMMQVVQQNNMAHLGYASEVYMTAQQDLYDMHVAYQNASEQTAANVDECIMELQTSRENINSQNIDMLLNFTELLEYTREGSQENVEAYAHIVDPVVSIENGTQLIKDSNGTEEKGITVKQLLTAMLIVGCMVVFFSIISYFQNGKNVIANEKEGA